MDIQLAPEGYLRISWYTADTECLGPGRRFALWVQGCQQRCEGCIAKPLQSLDGGLLMDISSLAAEIVLSGKEGLSISGGEPFLQSRALAELIRLVRQSCPKLGVIVYTGLLYENLIQDEATAGLIAQTDLIIDGAYVKELDDGRAMRGSSNQRLIFLTDRYSESDLPTHRQNKVIFSGSSFRMIGIPSEGARQFIDIMKFKGENE